jgi:hypothetical protein
MSIEHTFGELRSLLEQAPSEEVWATLCEHCHIAARGAGRVDTGRVDTGRFEAEVLPYILDRLRGWPDALRIARMDWLDEAAGQGDHVCLPLVRHINVEPTLRTPKELRRMWNAPGLGEATMVSAGDGQLKTFSLDMLRGAPITPNLRELRLREGLIHRKKLGVVSELAGLRALHTGAGERPRLLLEALGAHGMLPKMERLWMGVTALMQEHAALLASCGALEELAIWSNLMIADEGFEVMCDGALADAPLTSLNVGGCGLTLPSFARLAASRWPLRSLYWWGNSIGAAELELLAGSRVIEGLQQLNIGDGRMGGGALAPLLSRRGPSALRELWLARGGEIGAAGMEAGVSGEVLRGLAALHTEMCRWEERAFPALLAGLSGGSIAQLFLRSNGLDDTSAAALAAADLPALRTLDLSNNQLTNVGLAALLEAPWITQLEVLDISNCLVDADMRQRAAASGVSLKRIG